MADPLSGARMRLQRAEEHFGQLHHEHGQFLARNPYRMLREHNFERGEGYYLWRAKIVEPPPHERWASLIGECAHSLRAALDYTAYVLVNGKKLVSEKSAFPILDDPKKWASVYPDYLPGVDPKALAEIEQLQPYNKGKDRDHLWIVHMLDIIDKHRRLGLVDATVHGTQWRATLGQLSEVDGGIGPFSDGSVAGRFKLVPKPGDPRMLLETHFMFGLTIGEDEPGGGDEVFGLLENLRSYVGGVVTIFEQFV
jgi:hypothetical protein